jgi:hypothetical protein
MGLMNAPAIMLPVHIAVSGFKALLWGWRIKQPIYVARGVARGYLDCLKAWRYRRPMKSRAYWLYRWLSKRPVTPLAAVESRLPLWRSESPSSRRGV